MVEMVAAYVAALKPLPVKANPEGERLLSTDKLVVGHDYRNERGEVPALGPPAGTGSGLFA